MPGQHDESVEFEKRLRYESSDLWDETSEPSFPGRWTVQLVIGAAASALHRAADECIEFVRNVFAFCRPRLRLSWLAYFFAFA
jgi:hypothetical protein